MFVVFQYYCIVSVFAYRGYGQSHVINVCWLVYLAINHFHRYAINTLNLVTVSSARDYFNLLLSIMYF